ncbi:tetratricopeptide repeat protein [Thermodesulfobacteriota bacterium]
MMNLQLKIYICIILSIATILLFLPVKNHEFIDYDVHDYVIDNPNVRKGITYNGILWAFTHTVSGNWHPITLLSHMLDCELYGLNPKGHHISNLLFHIANTVLLFLVLMRMTCAIWMSAFVAALFAIHPLHVESVAWIAERKDVLSTFFWMLAIYAYMHYIERPCIRRYIPILLFFAMGLMSKPMLVTLPFFLLLLDYWPLRRFDFGGSRNADESHDTDSINLKSQMIRLFHLTLEKVPLLAISTVACIITILAQQSWGAVRTLETFPLNIRIANSLISYICYIGKMIWPHKLAVFYPHPGDAISLLQATGSALTLAFITVLVFRIARQYPFLTVGWFWYLGILLPVIGLIQVGDQKMADRYTYVPIIGLFIILAWGCHSLSKNWRYRKIILTLLAGFALSYSAIFTRAQLHHWNNSIALFEHALDVTSNNYIAHYNLGIIQSRFENPREAVRHFSEALKIDPESSDAHFNLGYIFTLKDDIRKAIYHYHEALRIDPDHERAHNDLGVAFIKMGKLKDAISHFSEALRISPGYLEAKNNLSVALQESGDYRDGLIIPDNQ